MATQQAVTSITLPAAADYSTTGQFRFMDCDTSGQAVLVASAGADGIGVLQNDPAAVGRDAEVAIAGIVKVYAGGTVAAASWVQSDANGAAIDASTSDYVFGMCVSGGAVGELIEVLLVSQHQNAA